MSNDLTIYRGDAVSFDVTLELEGVPINLDNYYVFFTIKKKKTDSDEKAVVLKNSDNAPSYYAGGISVVDSANGIVRIALLHDDTKDLLEGSHVYGINCVNKSDTALVYTLLQGNFIVNLDIGVRIEPFENQSYYVYGNDGVNGEGYYYPVYLSPVNLGQYHTHVIDCVTYYMKYGSSNHAEPTLPADSSLSRAPGTCDNP